MTTSPSIAGPSKPVAGERVPETTLEYMRTRTKMRVFTLVQQEFDKAGITQAELARRLGKGTDRVCKMLGSPGNWTLDTVADLLFAISGAEVNCAAANPLGGMKRDQPADTGSVAVPVAASVRRQAMAAAATAQDGS